MCEKAKIEIKGKSVYVVTESGSVAFIPVDKLCEAAKRFNICFEGSNVKCVE
jgi:hypothetical protein